MRAHGRLGIFALIALDHVVRRDAIAVAVAAHIGIHLRLQQESGLRSARGGTGCSARRAVELAPANPLARFAMARAAFIKDDLHLFYTEASNALSLNPHDPLLLGNLGNWMAFSGRWDEGVALIKKAIALNPKGYPRWWDAAIGKDHYRKGAFREALAEFRTMNLPDWWWNQVELAYTYGQLG